MMVLSFFLHFKKVIMKKVAVLVDGGRGKSPSFGVDRFGSFFNNLLVVFTFIFFNLED